ncbi:MAG: UDP-N-acetylmuramate--L-alanine ligase, partial [Bdellovibrionota bacterium]
GASLVVYSSAVSLDNPELEEARRRRIPVVKRAEVLAELMRLKFGIAVAGAHGKTSTTSLIGWIFEHAGLDPTVVIGGQVKQRNSGGRKGDGDVLIAEADESDRSFLLLKPAVALVTNIDREHMDAYESEKDLQAAFEQFISSVPFYGLAVLCIDDPYLQSLSVDFPRRLVTYGFSEAAYVRGVVQSVSTDGTILDISVDGNCYSSVRLPMMGRHFAQNALGAVAVALEFGLQEEQIRGGLESFPGVERRLEHLGVVNGALCFSDYGHHPVEIQETLRALREGFCDSGRSIRVIFQPHRYSRTEQSYAEFCECFVDCDELWVTDIYAAGEAPRSAITGHQLASDVKHGNVHFLCDLNEGLEGLFNTFSDKDVVLFLGAGSIGIRGAHLVSEKSAERNAA